MVGYPVSYAIGSGGKCSPGTGPGEPAAAVLCRVRLCADARSSSTGAERYRVGECTMQHDSTQATEDRGAIEDHGAQGVVVVLRVLSVCECFRADSGESARPSAVGRSGINPSFNPTVP